MNYHDIKHDDLLNGDGIRVTLFVSGCTHKCPECQNPQTWSYESGIKFDEKAQEEIFNELSKDYIQGITLSGGDVFAPKNAPEVYSFVLTLKEKFPDKDIWAYTGYTFDELVFNENFQSLLLKKIDVLVDGTYQKDLRDTNLKWRGSKNQRVIDVQETLRKACICLHCD